MAGNFGQETFKEYLLRFSPWNIAYGIMIWVP